MKMATFVAIALYFWCALWTGVLISGTYKPNEGEGKRVFGSIFLGALWPVFLPMIIVVEHYEKSTG